MKVKQIFTMFLCTVLITCSVDYSALAEENDGQGSEHIHNYSYVDKENGTHDKMCGCMEESENEVHEYSDGICVCGAEEELESYNETEHELSYVSNNNGTHKVICGVEGCGEHNSDSSNCVYNEGVCSLCSYSLVNRVNCGDGVKWEITGTTLRFYGDGELAINRDACVYFESCNINKVIIDGDISSISSLYHFPLNKVQYVYIYAPIEEIAPRTFGGNGFIFTGKEIILPNTIKKIGDDAFYGCIDLEKINLPEGLVSIGPLAFYGCIKLNTKIPESVESVGEDAFYNCHSMGPELQLSDNIKEIGKRAFSGCSSISTLKCSDDVLRLLIEQDAAMRGWDRNINISHIPEGTKRIGNDAFSYKTINGLEIPDSVVSIGENSFYSFSSTTDIIVPENVKSIGKNAFGFIGSKIKIVISGTITDVGESPFRYSYVTAVLPCNEINKYRGEGDDNVLYEIRHGNMSYDYDVSHHWEECDRCDFTQNVDEHSWTAWEIVTPATHFTTGEKKRTCSVCGKEETETIAVIPHLYSSTWSTSDEKHWHECECGDKKDEATHTWSTWENVTPATHFVTGTKKRTCGVCEKEETETIEIIPHSYSTEWSKSDEKHWHECECGDKKDEAPHTWSTWETVVTATHFTAGVKKRTCSVCGKEETETITKIPHSYSVEWSRDDVKHWHECECGDKKDEATHEWSTWENVTPATHFVTGTKKRTCGVCGKEETETIEIIQHSYGTEWSKSVVGHWYECECGDKKDESTHTWGEWETVTLATHLTEGVKKHECSICHYEETDIIPKDETHSFSADWHSSILGHWKVCECGDNSEVEPHSYGSWEVVLDSTHISEGVKKHSCSICDYVETDTIEKIEEHEFGDNWQKNADEHWKVCTCGAISSTEPHNMSTSWEVIVEPTYSSVGKEKKSCECGYTIYQDIPRRSQEEITIEVVPSESGAPDSSVINLPNIVKDNIYGDLLAAEKAEFDSGNPVKVYTKVNSATVSEIVKNKAETAAGTESNVCIYLDISLYVKVGSQPERSIEPGGPVTVKFELPEEYKNTDSSKKRTYKIVHILSNGDVETLTCYYNSNDNTITFTTTSFSEFALAYTDTDIRSENPHYGDLASKESREVHIGKSEEKTIVITPSLPYMTISGLSTGSLGDITADLKALNTTERDRVNHIIFSNYYASKKNLKATVLDTKDIYAPSSVSKEWKATNRILTWKNSGAKLGDLIYVTWYCQEAHDMRFIPAIVSGDGTVYFAVPCTGNVSTVSIVKLTF